jgi:ornithine cyclodeaminase/alanine dehydrogenase-like protein (mu-crystallin family)
VVLVLGKQEVASLLEMPPLIDAVEGALIALSAGSTINPNRLRIFVAESRSMMACMPAYLGEQDLFGAKIVVSADRPVPPGEPRLLSMLAVLADTSGKLLAVMSAAGIGPLRTAAASAVATRHLARPDARSLAIIGCGAQCRAELVGVAAVRELGEVFAYDINRSIAETFQREMSARSGLAITLTDSAEEAVSRADIVTIATTSDIPVVASAAIRPGTHINAVGAHTPKVRELDSETVARARLFAESRPVMLAEAGDVLIPIGEGLISEAHILGEIGEVAAGAVPGRLNRDDITIFKSTGIALEDVIAAKVVYDAAKAAGIGIDLDL